MRIEIDRDDLLYALRVVKPAIHKRSLWLAAEISAAGDLVTLTAGDPAVMQVSVRVPATVHEEGAVLLPHKTALNLAQKMPRLPVSIASGPEGTHTTVSATSVAVG